MERKRKKSLPLLTTWWIGWIEIPLPSLSWRIWWETRRGTERGQAPEGLAIGQDSIAFWRTSIGTTTITISTLRTTLACLRVHGTLITLMMTTACCKATSEAAADWAVQWGQARNLRMIWNTCWESWKEKEIKHICFLQFCLFNGMVDIETGRSLLCSTANRVIARWSSTLD